VPSIDEIVSWNQQKLIVRLASDFPSAKEVDEWTTTVTHAVAYWP